MATHGCPPFTRGAFRQKVPVQFAVWSVEGSLQNGKPGAAMVGQRHTKGQPDLTDGLPLCLRLMK